MALQLCDSVAATHVNPNNSRYGGAARPVVTIDLQSVERNLTSGQEWTFGRYKTQYNCYSKSIQTGKEM